MKRLTRIAFSVLVLVLATIACRSEVRRELVLYPSPTFIATQTPIVVQVTTTPVFFVVEITSTPGTLSVLCVNAFVAVHLRPSPNDQNYPIMVIPNGTQLVDLGGRSDKWLFVELGDKQGWVHRDYVVGCP